MSDRIARPVTRADSILVVDDQPALRDTIAYNLKREGFVVNLAADGPSAIAAARTHKPDLVILDVMLPGLDGFEVCRILRAETMVPILMLSAKGEAFDRVLGLEIGADDYLTKPFAMRELMARVRANLRRMRMLEAAPPPEPDTAESLVVEGDVTIDPARRSVSLRGISLPLKPKEFDLLLHLVRSAGRVLSREELLREVWGYDVQVDTRTLDVHIRWLRLKLEDDPANPVRIETVRGYGYRYVGVAP